jgi:hypothetical protein
VPTPLQGADDPEDGSGPVEFDARPPQGEHLAAAHAGAGGHDERAAVSLLHGLEEPADARPGRDGEGRGLDLRRAHPVRGVHREQLPPHRRLEGGVRDPVDLQHRPWSEAGGQGLVEDPLDVGGPHLGSDGGQRWPRIRQIFSGVIGISRPLVS